VIPFFPTFSWPQIRSPVLPLFSYAGRILSLPPFPAFLSSSEVCLLSPIVPRTRYTVRQSPSLSFAQFTRTDPNHQRLNCPYRVDPVPFFEHAPPSLYFSPSPRWNIQSPSPFRDLHEFIRLPSSRSLPTRTQLSFNDASSPLQFPSSLLKKDYDPYRHEALISAPSVSLQNLWSGPTFLSYPLT